VPYATIDNIANEAIEEYKSMLKEGNNNEWNHKSSWFYMPWA
jgi:hypothetical protein